LVAGEKIYYILIIADVFLSSCLSKSQMKHVEPTCRDIWSYL